MDLTGSGNGRFTLIQFSVLVYSYSSISILYYLDILIYQHILIFIYWYIYRNWYISIIIYQYINLFLYLYIYTFISVYWLKLCQNDVRLCNRSIMRDSSET